MRDEDWIIIDTLYNHPSLTKAANMLYISQPALTKRLQRIEEEFNVLIAIRGQKGVVFTPQGEYLAQQAAEIIAHSREIRYHLTSMESGSTGILKIAAPNAFARFDLPELLKAYSAIYPKINFQVNVALSSDILKLVQERKVHVGFVRCDREHNLGCMLFSSDSAWIVSNRRLMLADLPTIPLIEHNRDLNSQRIIELWWKENFDCPPMAGIRVDDVDTTREMVSLGLGFGIFYNDYIRAAEHLHKLPMFFKDGCPVRRNTWMLYHKDCSELPIVRQFLEFVAVRRGTT